MDIIVLFHCDLILLRAFPVKRLATLINALGLDPKVPIPAVGKNGVEITSHFSVDLVAAVKRQASFIAQVVAVGWTHNPEDIHTLVCGAINRYHCFLKALWENNEASPVPTLVG